MSRRQETGDRSQETGVRSQETGVRRQESGSQESGVRSQESGRRCQESGVRWQGQDPDKWSIKQHIFDLLFYFGTIRRHAKNSTDIQGLNRVAKGSSIRSGDLFAHGKLSQIRNLLSDQPNASRFDFRSGEHRGRV